MRKFLLMIISLLLLLTVSGVTIWQLFKKPTVPALSASLSADELLNYTVETQQLTTNLAERGFILLQFQLQADSTQAKQELEQRMPQVRHLIIRTVSVKTLAELRGAEGIANLEQAIQRGLNQLIDTGQVIKVYTTKIIAQD